MRMWCIAAIAASSLFAGCGGGTLTYRSRGYYEDGYYTEAYPRYRYRRAPRYYEQGYVVRRPYVRERYVYAPPPPARVYVRPEPRARVYVRPPRPHVVAPHHRLPRPPHHRHFPG